MRTIALTLLSLALTASAARAQAGPPSPSTPARPAYLFLRWQEDWSVIPKLAPQNQDALDSLKYIPLDPEGSDWMSLGGDARARVESWSDFNFGAPVGVSHDDTFLLTRFRADADVHLGPGFRAFLELKSDEASGRNLPGGVRTADQDRFELQQLFADFTFPLGNGASLILRPGRQQFSFGVQRLVSPLPWANSLRTWDGLSALVNAGAWNVTTFAGEFVPIVANGVGRADHKELLGGIYARHVTAAAPGGLELYVLRNDWERPHTFNGTTGADRRWTLGLRRWQPLAPRADYEVELDYQFGDTGPGSASAWSLASQVGYQVRADKSLRIWAGFDWASGDRTRGGDVQTFNQLYPLGHAYLGKIDTIGRQNILDESVGLTWRARPKLVVNVEAHDFQADSTQDAIYNAAGGVVRAGGTYHSHQIGYEPDLIVAWSAGRHVAIEGGGGHFFPGDAIRESGPALGIDFVYLQTTLTF